MTYDRIKRAKKLAIGTNQTTKALEQATAKEVYVAKDAERRLVSNIEGLCKQKNTPLVWVESMRELGKACGIAVGAAAAAILEE
jgi:large subunit ribosomal protein L7A